MKQTKQIPISVKTKDFAYDFSFNIPENNEAFDKIKSVVINNALQSDQPISEAVLQDAISTTYKVMHFDTIMEAALRDLHAEITKSKVLGEAGNIPIPRGSGGSELPAPKPTKKIVAKQGGRTFA